MEFINLNKLPDLEIAKGINANAVNTDSVTVLHVRIEKGALLPEHSHHNEQVVNVIDGELELIVKGKNYLLKPGRVMVLEPNVVHSGRAISACKVIDVFHPARKDFADYPREKK